VLSGFHPLVALWFERRFATPTEPQEAGWPAIQTGRDALISAPTGSGKTLAAFLFCLDRLVRQGLSGALEDETQVLYISPLKALGNDIEKNLSVPLDELEALARAQGLVLPPVRVAVRSGDTPAARRQAMLKKPPHVLVTTPESFYLLITSRRGRAMLSSTRTVICDEIHAVARDKRGAHLSLSLERLELVTGRRPQRIGLSATQHPIEEVARFLVGANRVSAGGDPDCAIVEIGRRRHLDLAIEIPKDELSSVASNELWAETYDRVATLAREHRTTLVFVNTRRLAERAAHALGERLGTDKVAAHHGSLSRARRLEAEQRLRRGDLTCVVATSSLELGIDVGAVELVVQLGSPGAISTGVQRIGRSGHWRGAVPKGRLFPMSRDELIECGAFVRAAREGRIEETLVPSHPLDVLAQQVAAEVASAGGDVVEGAHPDTGGVSEDTLFERFRHAWPYRDLEREEFAKVVSMLSEGVAAGRGRSTALLHRDAVHGLLRGRRGARLSALTGGGAIPDNAQYQVVAEPEGALIGQVDEDFAVESLAGDVFLLGNTSWRIRRIEAGTVRVEDAHGEPPGVPFWMAEHPGRSAELSREVSDLREEIESRLAHPEVAVAWLAREGAMSEAGARQAVDYLAAGRAVLSVLPTQRTLVAERFFDEGGGMQLVLHAPFGARLNRALGLALRKSFCRTFDFELQAAATNEGVLLSLGPQHSFPLESVFELVDARNAREVLTAAALQSPMFPVRFRWDATRALAIPRMLGGKKIPPTIARMRADDLLAQVFPQAVACQDNACERPRSEPPDHPIVKEALHDCLHEAMDYPALARLLSRIESGEVALVARDTAEPSPLSHEIVGARPWAYLDDAPLEERRSRAVHLRRALPDSEAAGLGALDPAAVQQVAEEVWPDVRDPDELHDVLLDLCLLPARDGAPFAAHLDSLVRDGRAARAARPGGETWVAAERVALFATLDPQAQLDPPLTPLACETPAGAPGEATARALRGWLPRLGPTTAQSLAARLDLPPPLVHEGLLALERDGVVLRGRFLCDVSHSAEAPHWCERGVLARIHRLTLGRLRREIEPVGVADFIRFLTRWQHALAGQRLHSTAGLAEVVGQLQGFHAPAGAWEREILPARISNYEPAALDALCLRGEVAFGRLAVDADPERAPRRRNAPTRNAPVTLALRPDLSWLAEAYGPPAALSPSAQALVELLARVGASFLGDLSAMTGRLPGEIESTMWELVSAGAVTCDAFAGLRTLIDAERPRHGRGAPFTGGRWSLLPHAPALTALAAGSNSAKGPTATGERRWSLVEKQSGQYLRRWGVVFRDLLAREPGAPPWRELLAIYRRREAVGDIRGGRFVGGFSGEQFALPEAICALRAVRRAAPHGSERVDLSATDPLNLIGLITPGARIPATLGSRVAYVNGVPAPPQAMRALQGVPDKTEPKAGCAP